MPDKRCHRGPHPEDADLFAPAVWPTLRQAVGDLSWLLSRGYAEPSSLKLVGDRFDLTQRQRTAVMRCACSDESLTARRGREVDEAQVRGGRLVLDGYNVLTTIEAAMADGIVIAGRDGCYRDMASMHGTWRKVEETIPAVTLIGEVLEELGASSCVWYLDSPVSNSGRLRGMIETVARERGWSWQVELVTDPDAVLIKTDEIVATADSMVLDRCRRWFNLARIVTDVKLPATQVIDLALAADEGGHNS